MNLSNLSPVTVCDRTAYCEVSIYFHSRSVFHTFLNVVGFSRISDSDTKDQPKSLISDPVGMAEKSELEKTGAPEDGNESNKTPKRPNDENISNPKKKVSVIVTALPHFSVFSLEPFI